MIQTLLLGALLLALTACAAPSGDMSGADAAKLSHIAGDWK